jgi:hypothetical protein
MSATIKNISQALIEIRPDFMWLLDVAAKQRKINGMTGEMKYVPWITIRKFRIATQTSVTDFDDMSFWPNTCTSYDTEAEALEAGWTFVNDELVEPKWIFTQIWNAWATEG